MDKTMIDVFESLGFDEETITREGQESSALRSNPYWSRAVAEYKYLLLMKEDAITADPSIDGRKANEYRKYYSMLRLLLNGLESTLDQKIMLAENADNVE